MIHVEISSSDKLFILKKNVHNFSLHLISTLAVKKIKNRFQNIPNALILLYIISEKIRIQYTVPIIIILYMYMTLP